MPSTEELEWLRAALREIDRVLISLADFRPYPGLLDREDPALQSYLEHVVHGVQDSRALNARAIERVEEFLESHAEEERRRVEAEAEAANPTPVAPPEPVLVRPPVDIERITMANPTGMRELVLVVDTDPQMLAQVEEMLTAEDFRVLSIRDSFEAISIYTRLWAAIDLVIIDFDMPGMNGDLIFEELMAVNPQVAAVVSGGLAHTAKLKAMLGRGLSGFLPKPYNRERLINQVQQILAHRPSPSSTERF